MMSKVNDGGPAFPTTWDASHNAALQTEDGMSLRDWFAGQALAGVVVQCAGDTVRKGTIAGHMAARAYEIADAMIAARTLSEGE